MSWRPRRSPSSGLTTPGVSRASARYLVTWSTTAIPAASQRSRTIRRRRPCWVMPVLPRHAATAAARWAAAVGACSATELGRAGVRAPGDVAAALDVREERLEVALQAGAVVALEDTQLVDLALQQRALLLELGQRAVVLLLRLAHDALGLGPCLVEDALPLLLAVVDVLVVQALGEGEHPGGGGRLVTRLGGGGGRGRGRREGLLLLGLGRCLGLGLGLLGRGRCGGGSLLTAGQLGDPPLGGRQLRLELLVLVLEGAQRVDDLVQEVVDLVLVVALPELRRLKLLVQHVVCSEQRHSRHLGSPVVRS